VQLDDVDSHWSVEPQIIPEFYQPVDSVEDNFLLNSQNLDLGVRQNQEKVNDVILPPWAKGNVAQQR